MKLKITPGGKIVLAILFIIIVYFLIRLVIGLVGLLFNKDKQNDNTIKTDTVAISNKIPNRNFRVGYVNGNLPESIQFANEQHEGSVNSIFKKNGLNVELIECKNYTELSNLLKSGGDQNGFDAVYCNTVQFVQKSNLFSESNSKVFLLSDKKTEKNYLVTHKNIKSLNELNNKIILVNDLNSSAYVLTQLLSQNKGLSAHIAFSTDNDKLAYTQLLSGDVAAILIKEQSVLDEIKNNSDYKIFRELNNSNSDVLISSSSTLDEYSFYIETFAKCCLIANDSLKIKKQLYPNITFADMNSNYSYFSLEPKKKSSAFESEISNIFNSIQKFITIEKAIVPRDLFFTQILYNICSASDKYKNINLPNKKDTLSNTKENNISAIQISQEQNQNNSYEYQNSISPTPQTPTQKATITQQEPTQKTTITQQKTTTTQKATTKKSNKSKKPKIKTASKSSKRVTPQKNEYKDPEIENDPFIINFGFNSTKINSNASQKLTLVAEEIKKQDSSSTKAIELIGHTDFYGKKSYNLKLSKKRASSVMNYLNKNFEIDKDRFINIGKGASSPIRNNRDYRVRKYNRRVNITIKEDE